MSENQGRRIESVRPRVPERTGELAWLDVRIDQIHELFAPETLSSLRVWGTPRTLERLERQWNADVEMQSRRSGLDLIFLEITPTEDGSWGWFDDRTIELDAITDQNTMFQLWTLVYPAPVPDLHLEYRWTFQMIDGMTGREAEATARRLSSSE